MRAGQLVVATPALSDPNFARTVVLLLQADAEDGALGLVLNRPTGTGVGRGAARLGAAGRPARRRLHRRPGAARRRDLPRARRGCPARRPAAFSPCWRGCPALDRHGRPRQPRRTTSPPTVEEVRLFAGYAGWSAGQLEAEVEEGAWWVLDALPVDAFSPAPEELWGDVLRRQGPPIAFAASYPPDPTLN